MFCICGCDRVFDGICQLRTDGEVCDHRLPCSLSSLLLLYQQVYDIFNMLRLGVILRMRGRDRMSTSQNGAAAYSQSHVSHICQGGFPLPSLRFSSS